MNLVPCHLTVFQVWPIDAGSCRFFYGFYGRAGAGPLEWLRARATWLASRYILREDKQVLAKLLTTRDFYVNAKYGTKANADKIERRHVKRGKYHTAFNMPLDWRWSAEQQPIAFPQDERAGVLTFKAGEGVIE